MIAFHAATIPRLEISLIRMSWLVSNDGAMNSHMLGFFSSILSIKCTCLICIMDLLQPHTHMKKIYNTRLNLSEKNSRNGWLHQLMQRSRAYAPFLEKLNIVLYFVCVR